MMRLIEEALEGRGTIGKEGSKTSLVDEESVRGTEEAWVERLENFKGSV